MLRLTCVSFLFSLILVGCGGGDKPLPLYPVTGSLKVNGKAVPDVTVQLTPVDPSTKSKPGIGKTDAEGNFKILTNGDKGANPGKYKVVLISAALAAQSEPMTVEQATKLSGDMTQKIAKQGKGAMSANKPLYPVEWGKASTSPKEVEITDKAVTIPIDI